MGIGAFSDKQHQPVMKEILASIRSKKELWEKLDQFIVNNYRTKPNFAFYGKNYGWALRYRKAGKALLSMYPGKGNFTVQIVLGPTHVEKAYTLKLGKNVRSVLENAHQFPEGRWLLITARSRQDIADIQQLLLLKARPASDQ